MNTSSTTFGYMTTVGRTKPGEMVADLTFGVAEITSVIIGLLLNAMTIPHFSKTKKLFSNFIYLLIVLVDILTLVSCIPTAISMLYLKRPMFLGIRGVCNLSGFVFNIVSRMSVFLIALLGTARCVSILFPFTKPKLWYYFTPLVLYFIANVSLALLPLFFSSRGYHYARFLGQCSWGIHELSFVTCYGMNCSEWIWMAINTVILPWLIPGLVVIVTSSASVVMLKRSTNARKRFCKRSRDHFPSRVHGGVSPHVLPQSRSRYATITILIMTVIYCVFNMPGWLLYSYLLGSGFNPAKWLRGDIAVYLQIFVSRLSVVMNSAVNPVVYFSRMESLTLLKMLRISRRRMSKSIISKASDALKLVPYLRPASGPDHCTMLRRQSLPTFTGYQPTDVDSCQASVTVA